MKNISQEKLREVMLQAPPLEEQMEISRLFELAGERSLAEVARLAALEETKAALLSALLTGEVRVTPDPEPA
jgi:restriction endonuclease S subunit